MMRRAASRIRWYSLSVSVSAGATVMLSPVCTPIASMFSIEQMTTKLSAQSRITSSSNSFQPITDSLDQDLVHGTHAESALDDLAELLDVVRDAAADAAEGERRADDERKSDARGGLERLLERVREALSGTSMPIDRIASLNCRRSSATLMAVIDAPISCDAVLGKHALLFEFHREIQRGLAADGRQQRVRLLARDHAARARRR